MAPKSSAYVHELSGQDLENRMSYRTGVRRMNIAYLDCFSGISGDMVLGAILDLGLEKELLLEELRGLNLKGYEIRVSKEERMSIHGTRCDIFIRDSDHPHRSYSEIRSIILDSGLKEMDKELSLKIFDSLARAEAKIHMKDINEIQFHEIGAIDSIIDIVGSAIGINRLGVGRIYSSEIPIGRGFVSCHHGILPLPAPATLELLRGIPLRDSGINAELVTPTGAAILCTVAKEFGKIPPMKVERIGYGVGKDFLKDRPNLLRIIVGEGEFGGERKDWVIEANIDDMNPQLYDYLMERLLEEGALDVTFSPLQMKKNRPGILLKVLCDSLFLPKIIDCIVQESTTIGLRYYEVNRYCLEREIKRILTPWGYARIKISTDTCGNILNVLPEYDDCKRIAKKTSIPLKEVYQKVIMAYLEEQKRKEDSSKEREEELENLSKLRYKDLRKDSSFERKKQST
jgi:uncharacterized protein (TIGR00299 family) protein